MTGHDAITDGIAKACRVSKAESSGVKARCQFIG